MARKVGITRDQVCDVAQAIADSDGLDAVTLARVAELLGVRSPSLYADVDGLEGLRRELALRGAEGLADTARRSVIGDEPGRDLSALSYAYREFAHDHPGIYQAAQVDAPAPATDPELSAALIEPVEIVADVVGRLGLTGSDAIHAIRAWRAAVHGFVSLERAGGFGLPEDIDESFSRLVDVIVAGVREAAAMPVHRTVAED